VDASGRIVEANDRALDFYGYSRDEFLTLNVRDLVHPSAISEFDAQWPEFRDQKSVLFERLHARRDGSALPVEVSARVIEVEGKVFRQSIIRDITERRRAQAALLESENRFRQVVESAPEGIIVEVDRRMQYVNPAALRLLGAQSASQLLDRGVGELIRPDELAAATERAELVDRGEYVPPVERRFVRLDGSELASETAITHLDYHGRPGILVFLHDLSERKRAEAEHALLEGQLRQAQKMESVGRLAGGVAHDFNNHLTVINGYCDMLLAGFPEGNPARESIEEIRAAGERAAALTNQLLAFSRKQIAEPQPVDLNEVVAEAGGMLRRLIGTDIEVVTSLATEPAVVIADRGQMNQILMNLAVNARDAMPEGGKLVIETQLVDVDDEGASLHPDARPGRFVVLSVTDTGVGMAPGVLQRIFEPFYTTKTTGAGTGLGLATVHGIVHQSGGWIAASSEPGRGACFRVYLAAAVRPEEAAPAQPAVAGDGRGSETVLLVEDHPEVRRLTREMLRQRGYRLIEAADGAEALALAAGHQGPIDALVTDVVMPGMNGRELAARLLQQRPLVKVLLISGYAAGALGTQGVLDPGLAYLPKPFTAAQLALKLRQVIQAG
jgi:PAS domain S-box-containing protein